MLSACLTKTNKCIPYVSDINLHNRKRGESLRPVQTLATLLANKTQHCWAQHVVSVCTPCCVLLRVVATCWKLLDEV